MVPPSHVRMQWLQIFGITHDKNTARYEILKSGFISRHAVTTVITINHTKHSSVHHQNTNCKSYNMKMVFADLAVNI
jgi:hypothetical protein